MTPNTFLKKFKKIDLPLHGVRLPSFEISEQAKREHEISDEDDNNQIIKCHIFSESQAQVDILE